MADDRAERLARIRAHMSRAEPYDEPPYGVSRDAQHLVAALGDVTHALLAVTEALLLPPPSAGPGHGREPLPGPATTERGCST